MRGRARASKSAPSLFSERGIERPDTYELHGKAVVDGGITPEIAPRVAQAGANVLVAGAAVIKGGKADSYRANIAAIRNAAALARREAA